MALISTIPGIWSIATGAFHSDFQVSRRLLSIWNRHEIETQYSKSKQQIKTANYSNSMLQAAWWWWCYRQLHQTFKLHVFPSRGTIVSTYCSKGMRRRAGRMQCNVRLSTSFDCQQGMLTVRSSTVHKSSSNSELVHPDALTLSKALPRYSQIRWNSPISY